MRGVITAFNVSPRGDLQGALVETADGPAQVNFPKHDVGALARSLTVGSKVDLAAEPESDEGDHPVYRLRDAEAEVHGSIARLNYALHGEVNGFHLDPGVFVHLKLEGAKKYKPKVGEKVTVTGVRRAGPAAVVLEARTVQRAARRA